jgi:hypothetical protein
LPPSELFSQTLDHLADKNLSFGGGCGKAAVNGRNAHISAVIALDSDNEGMTKESSIARVLLVLVFAPSGGLFGKAVADAAAGLEWWPWLVAALVWLVLSGLVSVAVTSRFEDGRSGDRSPDEPR